MAKFDVCHSALVKNQGFTPEEAQAILDEIRSGGNPEEIANNAQRYSARLDFVKESRANAGEKQQQAYAKAHKFIFQDADPSLIMRRFLAYLTGSTREGWGMLNSIASEQMARADGINGRLITNFMSETGLSKSEFRRLVRNKAFGKDVVRELYPFDGKQKYGNKEAFVLAKLIAEEQRIVTARANKNGGAVWYDPQEITTEFHNRALIKQVDKKEWVEFVSDLADKDRMSRGPSGFKKKTIEDIYDRLTKSLDDVQGIPEKSSLGEVMSRQSMIIFKNPDAWMAYNARFGHEDPLMAIIQGLEIKSDNAVMLGRMGPDIDQTYKALLQAVKEKTGTKFDENAVNARYRILTGEAYIPGNVTFQRIVTAFNNFHIFTKLGMATISSFSDVFATALTMTYQGKGFLSTYETALRNIKRTALNEHGLAEKDLFHFMGLGVDGILGSTINRYVPIDSTSGKMSRMADAMFHWNGLNWWTNAGRDGFARMASAWMAEQIGKTFDELDPSYQRVLYQYGIDGEDWAKLNKAGALDMRTAEALKSDVPIIYRKSTHKRGGQAFGDQVMAYYDPKNNEIIIDRDLAMQKFNDKAWTKPKVKGVKALPDDKFKTYDEWERFLIEHEKAHTRLPIKKGEARGAYEQRMNEEALVKLEEINQNVASYTNEKYMTPDHVRRVLGEEGLELADKLEVFFVNEAKIAVPAPGKNEQAIMMRNFKRGTVPGALAEMFWLFRSFGLTFLVQQGPRALQQGSPVLWHLAPAIALGYASMSIKDMIRGKEPKDPTEIRTITDSLIQSGAAGIVGDLVYAEFTNYHRDFTDLAVGASASLLPWKDPHTLFMGLVGDESDASRAWKTLKSNTPYANLFFLEPIVNYGLLYPIQEHVNPGYLERAERAIKNLEGQEYYLSPTSMYGTSL